MDNSNKQASSSPPITEAEIQEAMPPEPGIFKATAIEEMMPPDWMPPDWMPPEPGGRRPEWRPPLPPPPPDPWTARIDRILAAVGKKIVPPDLDRNELKWALQRDIANYRDLDEFRSGHLWKDKAPELRELERLSSSVRSGDWPIPPNFGALFSVEKWCRSMLAKIEQGWHPEHWHPDFEGKSSITLLVGHILPKTFEKYFGRPAAATPTGPYVRFVMAILEEFNIKKNNGDDYKPGTISSAFDAVSNGYIRNKGCRVPQTTKPAEDIATFVPPQVPHRAPPF
jgi:hypothetical protein